MSKFSDLNPVQGYSFVKKLGEGTSGIVWKAEKDGQEFAIKILKQGYEDIVLAEYDVLTQMDHPNIIQEFGMGAIDKHSCTFAEDFDPGLTEGRVAMVMELLNGKPCDEVDTSEYTPEDFESIAHQFASGLAHAHDRGLIHRDLKPANVFVSSEKRLTILDFGVSSGISYDANEKIVSGSYSYMAPAQLLGKANLQNDIWGFGVTLYRFVTGKHPYRSSTLKSLGEKLLFLTVDPPNHVNPKVSPKLSYIIQNCLKKDIKDRYTSFSEILTDFKADPTRELVSKYGSKKRLAEKTIRMAKFHMGMGKITGLSFLLWLSMLLLIWVTSDENSSPIDHQLFLFFIIPLITFILCIISFLALSLGSSVYKFFADPNNISGANLIMGRSDFEKFLKGIFTTKDWRNTMKLTSDQLGQRANFNEYLLYWSKKNGFQDYAQEMVKKMLKKDAKNLTALTFQFGDSYESNDMKRLKELYKKIVAINPGDIVEFFYQQLDIKEVEPKVKTTSASTENVGIGNAEVQEVKEYQLEATVAAEKDSNLDIKENEEQQFVVGSSGNIVLDEKKPESVLPKNPEELSELSIRVFEEGRVTLKTKLSEIELYDHYMVFEDETIPFKDIEASESGKEFRIGRSGRWEEVQLSDHEQWIAFLRDKLPSDRFFKRFRVRRTWNGMSPDSRVSMVTFENSYIDHGYLSPSEIQPNSINATALNGRMVQFKGYKWSCYEFQNPEHQEFWYNWLKANSESVGSFEEEEFYKDFRPQVEDVNLKDSDAAKPFFKDLALFFAGEVLKAGKSEVVRRGWKTKRGRKRLSILYPKDARFIEAMKCVLQNGIDPMEPFEGKGVIEAKPYTFDFDDQILKFKNKDLPFSDIKSIGLSFEKVLIKDKTGKEDFFGLKNGNLKKYIPVFVRAFPDRFILK